MSTCKGPECDREAVNSGLCQAHYQQQHRGGALKPLRGDDLTEQTTFKLSKGLLKAATKAAKTSGVALPEWIRRAMQAFLKT